MIKQLSLYLLSLALVPLALACDDTETNEPTALEAGVTAAMQAGEPAGVMAGMMAGEPAGVMAGTVAGEPAGVMAGTVAGEPAGVMAGTVAGEPAGVMAGEPAGVMAGVMAGEPVGGTTAPTPLPLERVETTLDRGGRMIPTVAYLPEDTARYPLVVFTPGFQLSFSAYEPLLERVASAGYVVVALDPVGTILDANHLEMGADALAALDWALSGAVGERVDNTHVARVGHSLGGKLSLLNATQDPRVTLVIALDPVDGDPSPIPDPANRPTLAAGALQGLTTPVALLGELTNAESDNPFAPACAPRDNNFQTIYEALSASAWVLEWELIGADHMDFVYECEMGAFSPCSLCTPGTLDQARAHELTERFVLESLALHFKGEVSAQASLTAGATEVNVRQR